MRTRLAGALHRRRAGGGDRPADGRALVAHAAAGMNRARAYLSAFGAKRTSASGCLQLRFMSTCS